MPPVGPRMTADDYWGLPEGTRTELVDGELWDLVAPGRLHQGISMQLGIWFSTRTALRGSPCKVYAAPCLPWNLASAVRPTCPNPPRCHLTPLISASLPQLAAFPELLVRVVSVRPCDAAATSLLRH